MYLMPTENAAIYSTCQRILPLRLPDEIKILFPKTMATRCEAMSTLQMLRCFRPLKLEDAKDRIYAFTAMPTSDNAMAALIWLQITGRVDRTWTHIETSLFSISRRRQTQFS